MGTYEITKEQARIFMLSYHGLSGRAHPKGKEAILAYISRVGCIQFDPLNIVGHNQELVLQSRIDGFKPSMLQELLYKDRLLVDGWDKQMSIYHTGDWPYFSRYRANNFERLGNKERPVVPYLPLIRKEIKERGPLSSIELEFDQAVDWPWGPTRVSRAALESMYLWGELIIHHKVNTRKVYDFAERHLPKELLELQDPNETFEQYRDWRILRRIGGIGLLWAKAGDAWLDIPETGTPQRMESIQRLLASGRLAEVRVEGITAPLYMRSEFLPLLQEPATPSSSPGTHILAPLDNLLWDRRLIKELFSFDYRWEVYKPQQERTYGYYVLPVIYG
ncbi:MAG TPA: crosslink repair DNA glycosylase YcaQ family protein, partial [Clostridia bacterium]|nr:crosslink repair DNA glycosylase YcaQ family protein [Clostridia bacterium]